MLRSSVGGRTDAASQRRRLGPRFSPIASPKSLMLQPDSIYMGTEVRELSRFGIKPISADTAHFQLI